MLYAVQIPSPVGVITLSGDDKAIMGLWLEGQKYFGGNLPPAVPGETSPIRAGREWLDAYFSGENPDLNGLTLAPRGSPFAQLVWQLLREIPYGQVTTYGALAREVAVRLGRSSMSAQAVGGAVGHNPISILIPCHRVVGADGSLTGYAGSIARKRQLLELEGVDLSRLYVPKKGTAM